MGSEIMKLTKNIPARKKTLVVKQMKKDFSVFNDSWERIRPELKACQWCGKKFSCGDVIGLIIPVGKKNKVLCQDCCEELLQNN
jgi:hypothetical protein